MVEESQQQERFDFDGFWRDLIERFWRELLKSLLPTLCAIADLTKEPEFLDKELRDVLHIQDDRNSPRFVDMLLKIPLKGGGAEWILLHIEVQGPGGEDLTFRMYRYCSLIFAHYNRLPVALAILTAPREDETTGIFEASQHGTSIYYKFNCIELDRLDDNQLLASDNPFDLALCAARRAKRSRDDEGMKFRYLRELRRLLGQKGWSDRDCRDLLIFIEWIINLKDQELRENYASFSGETEETRVRFKALSTDHILNEGITIGEQRGISIGRNEGISIGRNEGITIGRNEGIAIGEERARRSIMERLIAGGVSPQQAAAFTGMSV